MKVLFDIVHPADVHFFRHTIQHLQKRGDHVLVTSRDKDVALNLLKTLSIPNVQLGRRRRGIFGLFLELLSRDWQLLRAARRFRPDFILSNNSPCGAHVASLLGKPSIVFDDTEINYLNRLIYYPLATEVHTPDCYRIRLGRKQRRYPGYHALAYLHPERFLPNPDLLRQQGLDPEEKRVFIRWVQHDALHDVGLRNLSLEYKRRLIRELSRHASVVISSEVPLPEDLQDYQVSLPVDHAHQLLAFSQLVLAESATMCAEAVALGTPAIYIDQRGRGYTDEMESRYGLCRNFRPVQQEGVLKAALAILNGEVSRTEFAAAHARLLRDKIDVSDYQLYQIDRLTGRNCPGQLRGADVVKY